MKIRWNNKFFYMSNYLMANLDNYVNGVMNKKTSAVFIIDGRSGLGKTTISSQISCYIANKVSKFKGRKIPKFSLDDMVWTPQEFIDKLKQAKEGDIVILDESMILSNRSAMSEMNKMVVIMMSLIRSKKIFVIFNVNSIFDLDRNLALHRADMLIHLYAEDDKFASRGRYMVIPSARGKLKNLYILGKKYYDYSKAQKAFNDQFTSFFPFDEKEYEKRKQIAIENYFSTHGIKQTKHKISRDNLIKFLYDKCGESSESICKIANISKATFWRAIKDEK